MNDKCCEMKARLATLPRLAETTVAAFLDPVPPLPTLRNWFEPLPKFKANPSARRGGGTVFYSVSAVEKFLRTRTMGKVAMEVS